MKIELVNDNQIRCILTKEDLADRQLKLSELAYGSEKAKELFRDMMEQANFQYGFEANEVPLMIEAIPVSAESIILIITKVEDPEELDTRFANFAPGIQGGTSTTEDSSEALKSITEGASDVLDLLKRIRDKALEGVIAAKAQESIATEDDSKQPKTIAKKVSDVAKATSDDSEAESEEAFCRIFSFATLDEVIRFAHVLKGCFEGTNTLYKMEDENRYYLEFLQGEQSPELINKLCNVASEYGNSEDYSAGCQAYLDEHCEVIIKDKALQVLAGV